MEIECISTFPASNIRLYRFGFGAADFILNSLNDVQVDRSTKHRTTNKNT